MLLPRRIEMTALIKKSFEGQEWIVGFCGTPSEIIMQFFNSGVREAYQQAWFSTGGQMGETPMLVNALNNAALKEAVTRNDVEQLSFSILGWNYCCIGCAETRSEAEMLCSLLDSINASSEVVSGYRRKKYDALLSALRNNFPEISIDELRKLFAAAMNLKL